jgi:hypothetical protein
MSVHLIKTVETYRCDTETEAKDPNVYLII